jgi:hypothetical protein
MEHRIKATFKKVQDADKFIDFLVDSGVDPESEIDLLYINGKHIVDYIVDDEYIDPEEAVAYDVDFLDDERIRHYSISLDGKERKH